MGKSYTSTQLEEIESNNENEREREIQTPPSVSYSSSSSSPFTYAPNKLMLKSSFAAYFFKQNSGMSRGFHGVVLALVESRPTTTFLGIRSIFEFLPIFAILVEFFQLLSFVVSSSGTLPPNIERIANIFRLRFIFPSVNVQLTLSFYTFSMILLGSAVVLVLSVGRFYYTSRPVAPFFLRFLLNVISSIVATYLFIPIVNVMLENLICLDETLDCNGSKYPLYAVFSVIALLIHIPFSLVVVLNSFTADPNSTDPLRRHHTRFDVIALLLKSAATAVNAFVQNSTSSLIVLFIIGLLFLIPLHMLQPYYIFRVNRLRSALFAIFTAFALAGIICDRTNASNVAYMIAIGSVALPSFFVGYYGLRPSSLNQIFVGILANMFYRVEMEMSSEVIHNLHLESTLNSATRLGQYASYMANVVGDHDAAEYYFNTSISYRVKGSHVEDFTVWKVAHIRQITPFREYTPYFKHFLGILPQPSVLTATADPEVDIDSLFFEWRQIIRTLPVKFVYVNLPRITPPNYPAMFPFYLQHFLLRILGGERLSALGQRELMQTFRKFVELNRATLDLEAEKTLEHILFANERDPKWKQNLSPDQSIAMFKEVQHGIHSLMISVLENDNWPAIYAQSSLDNPMYTHKKSPVVIMVANFHSCDIMSYQALVNFTSVGSKYPFLFVSSNINQASKIDYQRDTGHIVDSGEKQDESNGSEPLFYKFEGVRKTQTYHMVIPKEGQKPEDMVLINPPVSAFRDFRTVCLHCSLTRKLRKLSTKNGADDTENKEIEDNDVVRSFTHPSPEECAKELMNEINNHLSDIDKVVLEIASVFGNRTQITAVIDVATQKFIDHACAGVAKTIAEASFEKLVKLNILYKYCKGGYSLYQFSDGVIYNLIYDNIDPEARRQQHLVMAKYLQSSTLVTATLEIARHLRSAKECRAYVEILHNLSNMLQRRNEIYLTFTVSSEALQLAEESKLCKDEHNAGLMFQLHFNKSFAATQLGLLDINNLDLLRPFIRSNKQEAFFLSVSGFFGWSRENKGSDSMTPLEKAETAARLIAKEKLISQEAVFIYRTLGLLYRRLGRINDSFKYYELAINCARRIGNLGDMARAYLGMAAMERDEGFFALAQQTFAQSMNLLIWSGQFMQLVDAIHGFALLETLQGELQFAGVILQKAMGTTSTTKTPTWQYILLIGSIIDLATMSNSKECYLMAKTKWEEITLIRKTIPQGSYRRIFIAFLIWETTQCILSQGESQLTSELLVDSVLHKDLTNAVSCSGVQQYLKEITSETITYYIEELGTHKKFFSKVVGQLLKLNTPITKYGYVINIRALHASTNSFVILDTILRDMVPKLSNNNNNENNNNNNYYYTNNENNGNTVKPHEDENGPPKTISKKNSLAPLLSPPSLIGSLNSSSELLPPQDLSSQNLSFQNLSSTQNVSSPNVSTSRHFLSSQNLLSQTSLLNLSPSPSPPFLISSKQNSHYHHLDSADLSSIEEET